MRIRSIDRLIRGINSIDRTLASNHVGRIQERLKSGIDVSGRGFAPYKDGRRPDDQFRPLQRAAKLFEDATFSEQRIGDSIELVATVRGRAATIAHYQNVRRRFLGFSSDDRRETLQNVVASLRRTR